MILVTGANGFIGSATVEILVRGGAPVRAGTRRAISNRAAFTHELPVTFATCDLDRPDQVRSAVAGCSIVVHTAYGSEGAMVAQCRTLLQSMAVSGVSRLVFLSSIAVYGAREGFVDETMRPTAPLGAYARAKQGCEALVDAWAGDAARGERRAIVLRPGIVYGTGSRLWIDKMAERIECGAWGTFGTRANGIAALIHVDDLVEIIAAACRRLSAPDLADLAPVATINAIGPDTPTWNRYFEALAAKMGRSPLPELGVHEVARRQMIAIAAKIWRSLGLPGGRCAALAPTPGEMALFAIKANYARDAGTRLLGVEPRVTLDDGLARTRLSLCHERRA